VTLTDLDLIFKVTVHATLLRHIVALESVMKQLLSDTSVICGLVHHHQLSNETRKTPWSRIEVRPTALPRVITPTRAGLSRWRRPRYAARLAALAYSWWC